MIAPIIHLSLSLLLIYSFSFLNKLWGCEAGRRLITENDIWIWLAGEADGLTKYIKSLVKRSAFMPSAAGTGIGSSSKIRSDLELLSDISLLASNLLFAVYCWALSPLSPLSGGEKGEAGKGGEKAIDWRWESTVNSTAMVQSALCVRAIAGTWSAAKRVIDNAATSVIDSKTREGKRGVPDDGEAHLIERRLRRCCSLLRLIIEGTKSMRGWQFAAVEVDSTIATTLNDIGG